MSSCSLFHHSLMGSGSQDERTTFSTRVHSECTKKVFSFGFVWCWCFEMMQDNSQSSVWEFRKLMTIQNEISDLFIEINYNSSPFRHPPLNSLISHWNVTCGSVVWVCLAIRLTNEATFILLLMVGAGADVSVHSQVPCHEYKPAKLNTNSVLLRCHCQKHSNPSWHFVTLDQW